MSDAEREGLFRFFDGLGETEVRRRLQPGASDKWNDPYTQSAAQWIAALESTREAAARDASKAERAEDTALASRAAAAAERSAEAAEEAAASARDANSIALDANSVARAANALARQANRNTRYAWIAAAISAICTVLTLLLKR